VGWPKFSFVIWPIIAGAAYLLVAAAPADLRAKIPPAVLHWLPFTISFLGIVMGNQIYTLIGMKPMFFLGYAVVVFGLLARIAKPTDQLARIIIAVGACCCSCPGSISSTSRSSSITCR